MSAEPWNPTNPEWWRANVEARPADVLYEWLANEYKAVLVTPDALAEAMYRIGYAVFNEELRSYPDLDIAAKNIVWAIDELREKVHDDRVGTGS